MPHRPMETEGKLQLTPLTHTAITQMSAGLYSAEQGLRQAFETLANAADCEQVRRLVEETYALGTLKAVYEIFGGYVNRSCGAVVVQGGAETDYFIRKYKSGASDADIRVEHALIGYAVEHGMTAISRVIPCPDGSTFVRLRAPSGAESVYAVYTFLPGEDRYSWIDTGMTPAEDRSFGELLAAFHACTAGFDPGLKAEPPITAFLPQLRERFAACCAALPPKNRFRVLWEEALPAVTQCIDETLAVLSAPDIAAGLPECPCHYDFHPGNVKWVGETCASVFDFDWSKLDKRLFDVSYAALYACFSWESATNGQCEMQRIGYFLRGYDAYLREHPCARLPRFMEAEKRAFPHMVRAGLIYLFNWCASYCEAADTLNEFEYFYYLSHCVNALHGLRDADSKLTDIISSL